MTFRSFYRRRFLNRRGHHAGAYALAHVRIDNWGEAGAERQSIDASLTLADCSRIVVLDFSGDRPAEVRNALHKARALRAVVADFTDALERAVEQADLG